jgi:3-mercaptopyruvate sulfurtransferase SseA
MPAFPSPEVLADEDRRRALNPDRKGAFMNGYAHPEVLVETDWVQANLGKPGIKLVEIDVDTKAHDGSWTEYGSVIGVPIEK